MQTENLWANVGGLKYTLSETDTTIFVLEIFYIVMHRE